MEFMEIGTMLFWTFDEKQVMIKTVFHLIAASSII